LSPEAIQQMLHDLRVQKIELEIQNEALQHSHSRFRIAQEVSTDGFTILRPLRDVQEQIVDFTCHGKRGKIISGAEDRKHP